MRSAGRGFDLTMGLHDTELVSLKEYVHSLFPNLQLGLSTQPSTVEPLLAALISDGTVKLTKPESQPVQLRLDLRMDGARFNSALLPAM